jgi:hypothetical protein
MIKFQSERRKLKQNLEICYLFLKLLILTSMLVLPATNIPTDTGTSYLAPVAPTMAPVATGTYDISPRGTSGRTSI